MTIQDHTEIRKQLPKGLSITKDGYWKGTCYINKKRKRKNFGNIKNVPLEVAIDRFHEFVTFVNNGMDYLPEPRTLSWHLEIKKGTKKSKGWISVLHSKAKIRAKKKSLNSDLSIDDVIEIANRSNGNCELTGITFTDINPTNSRVRPFTPSLDRVNPGEGYTKENCRLICAAANIALMDFGEKIFKIIATAFLSKSLQSDISDLNSRVLFGTHSTRHGNAE